MAAYGELRFSFHSVREKCRSKSNNFLLSQCELLELTLDETDVHNILDKRIVK